jgi:hypothetical protein
MKGVLRRKEERRKEIRKEGKITFNGRPAHGFKASLGTGT